MIADFEHKSSTKN